MNKNIRNLIIILILAVGLGVTAHYVLNNNEKSPSISEDKDIDQAKKEDKNNDKEKDKDNEDIDEDENIDQEDEGPRVGIEVGKKLPDFKLSTLKGENVSLRDYQGKIVLINFWATWCVYCDEEMPDLQRLSEENDDLKILGVNVEEGKSLVQKYIDDGGYDFEVLMDQDGEVSRQYLVSGLPASYFVDEDGKFLGLVQGMLTYDQMNEILDDIRSGL